MKFAPVVLSSLLFVAAQAAAQAPVECPSLPASSGLQWQQQAQPDFVVCRAATEDGREVLSLMLSQRDPGIPLSRALRQEKGSFGGESMYWYQPDLGGQKPPGYAERRISVVKLDKGRYAQIALYPGTPQELGSLQQLAQGMSLTPSAVADGR
ncbi:TPA: hypothetical protein QDZ34_003805 [Stenotrophomonas maltophilia]|uniref:hypothetical protein n=1 Tax=Stenotrophomonas TaxID=40323 RepID=UPI0028A6A1AC|nr:hypothetical protein [Stenotrophomonas sp.]HDS0951522.1 hypothetical protein [Stenotrophomonas maltophilia]HDS1027989.1 hypothetical protein [Stenotrophomonas maltophilia]HDS1032225.1 hypothetical protein [Stenotrophomonas maltophilia]HDS1036410.1 hypothetical protein [Stenotrophomonas maltophilia]HDS1040601.1 hypothetical protein [Stenotrophomonas maltophilia]